MLAKKLDKGLIQVYTGDGKGKTTAALGQALRAVGNGYTVYMIQFLKGGDSGELVSVKKLEPWFQIFRFERDRGFFWALSDKEKEELRREVRDAFDFAKKVCSEERCSILILDEIMGVLHNRLLTEKEVCQFLREKPSSMEIILTGRNVPGSIKEIADLVTEMKMIKHPFEQGMAAREGIEW